jgi:DNA-binding NarL/FixJ family response regulator
MLEQRGFRVHKRDVVPGHVDGADHDMEPAAVIADAGLFEQPGTRLLEDLRTVFPGSSLILFGTSVSHGFVVRMLRLGIKGIVLVSEHENALFECMDRVLGGGTYLSPELLRQAVMAGPAQDDAHTELTAREKQVLRLIAEGSTTREVAQELQISVKTAVAHRSRIMEKLDIHDTATLVRFAIRTGLISA